MRAGHTGYVLKPKLLRSIPLTGTDRTTTMILSVKVISGWRLPRPYGNKQGKLSKPLVEVSVWNYGNVIQDYSKEEISKLQDTDLSPSVQVYTTSPPTNGEENPHNPIWNQQPFKFKVEEPELDMVVFKVTDTSSEDHLGGLLKKRGH